jgi:hypothetical protein
MKADFSGYATKAGLMCADGRTIMPDAFKHQHSARVPLVWQHGHGDPLNVLGHAILEHRPDGVYAYGFFNTTEPGKHARELVEHGDINAMSIWANKLIERGGRVLSGAIREVSLVLSGANPGALIENVTIRHSDGFAGFDETTLQDEVIIHTGANFDEDRLEDDEDDEDVDDVEGEDVEGEDVEDVEDEDVEDVEDEDPNIQHAENDMSGKTVQDVYDSLTEEQLDVLHFMIGAALEEATNSLAQGNTNEATNSLTQGNTNEGTNGMNVFENNAGHDRPVLSHDDMKGILGEAMRGNSLRDVVEGYALAHNITDIDTLFPEAMTVGGEPEWFKRRTEWVAGLIADTRKSPFARIKTVSADITMDEARAKGYVTGSLKKEEFFTVAKRTTSPTTIYKKQALDRDDIVDITDFDVVAWLKAEMRMMLDEELARQILVGDGRDVASEDKINDQCIRPIATDHEMYTTQISVNVGDAGSSMLEVIDAIILNRSKLKGTGTPNLYTTEYWIARFFTLRDGDNRRMYRSLDELALELRVAKIIPVEAMQETPEIVGILVNPADYVLGADKGGNVSMFDDFDIDYNRQKYLIETRVSGALTKLKSAMVVKNVGPSDILVTPASPSYVTASGLLTIVNQVGVVYKNGAGTVINAAGSPYTVGAGTTYVVNATPAPGYYFATSDDDSWSFSRPA